MEIEIVNRSDQMKKQLQLCGRVLNESGDVIPDARVVAVSGNFFQRHPIDSELSECSGLYENPHFAVTDVDGRFEIANSSGQGLKPNATLSVSVIAEGYAPLRIPDEWLPEEPPLDLGDLIVSSGNSISGRVVDELGGPLEAVQVLMAIDRGVPGCFQSYPGRGIPLTQTDTDGRFTARLVYCRDGGCSYLTSLAIELLRRKGTSSTI